MILNWLTRLLILIGISIISYSGYMIWSSNQQISTTLTEAKEIVNIELDQKQRQTVNRLTPNKNEIIGVIKIPLLNKQLPILYGTEEEQLSRGVGHYIGSSFPGEDGQIVLSGHRDTVFQGLGNLTLGDEIILDVEYGSFTYEIFNTYIVDADDLTVIDFSLEDEILLLTTCYPFQYVGNAPERYIIEAKRK